MEEWGLSDDTSTWLEAICAQPWAAATTTQQWIRDRAAKFGSPSARSFAALSADDALTAMKQIWQLIPVALAGFFGTNPPPSPQL